MKNKFPHPVVEDQGDRKGRPYTRIGGTIGSVIRIAVFPFWSLRRHFGQAVPVSLALLLLVSAIQVIGALHDISSTLTQRQVAQSWRGPFDLLVRPQSSVSQPERAAGWIDPQSLLETYGGITAQQVARITALPHVTLVTPVATVGWDSIAMLIPLQLSSKGVYRITATWADTRVTYETAVYYVEVTDLAHLVNETPLPYPLVEHVLAKNALTPVTYVLRLQAVQALVGVQAAQQAAMRQALLEGIAPVPGLRLSLHVERLQGNLALLPSCIEQAKCWIPQAVQQRAMSYQDDGVQLLRYSHTRYAATQQQLANGQVALVISGSDTQGPLYRVQLDAHLAVPGEGVAASASISMPASTSSSPALLPLSGPERMPLLAGAVRFISLDQACAVNGVNCYSALYMRLNGVERYGQRSLSLLQATAAAITARTGLHVDILDGSSPRTIALSGSPIPVSWRATGVAVQIVHGVDALQLTLLVLCLIVCLLAIGAAGILVGTGRRKDAHLLRQLGWPSTLLMLTFLLEALILCLPGCLLAGACLLLANWLCPVNLPFIALWPLLVAGALLYCCTVVGAACHSGERVALRLRTRRARVAGSLSCSIAVALAAFLIVEGWILYVGFDQVLVVTVLGNQVRAVLEGPQFALLFVVFAAALLTVGICITLLLRGRREELHLLSQVGWERRAVFSGLLWDNWRPALLSGELAVLLALAVALFVASLPAPLMVVLLLFCGPLVGALLVSLAGLVPAWRETERVFQWK